MILSTHRVLLRTWRADDTEVDKIVLLAKLREDVLTKAHLAAGHIGSAKTFALLQKYFFGLAFKNQSTNIVKVAQLVFVICKYQDLDYLDHRAVERRAGPQGWDCHGAPLLKAAKMF